MREFKLIFLLIIFFTPDFTHGQVKQDELAVEIGEKFKRSQKYGFPKMLGSYDGGVYSLQHKEKNFLGLSKTKKVFHLQYFDENLNLKHSAPIEFTSAKEASDEFIVQLGEQLYLFAIGPAPGSGEESLYAQEIDLQNLEVKGGIRKIATLPNNRNSSLYSFCLSPDKTKMLILFNQAGTLKGSDPFTLMVLDEELNLKWLREGNGSGGAFFQLEKSMVDNNANVYLLGIQHHDKRKNKRDGAPDYQYRLHSFKNNGKEKNEFSIQLAQKFLTDIQVVVNEQGDIIGGGFYSEKKSWKIEGSYFFRIDGETNEVASKAVKQFSPDFMKQELPGIFTKKQNSGKTMVQLKLEDFQLHDILLRKDGSAVLVGEQYVVSSVTKFRRKRENGVKSKTRYHYGFNDVILVNVNPEGEISWTNKITKKQHSIDDAGMYSSYALRMLEGNLYFIFNRNSKQEKGKKKQKWEAELVKVDQRGNKFNGLMPGLEHENITLMPGSGRTLGMNEWVMLGSNKRKSRFVKVKIKPGESFYAEKH